MNVLVTGASGQLGSEIRAQQKAHHFTYVDTGEMDLSSEVSIRSYFENRKFDIIINCAAYTAVDKAEDEPELAYAVNAHAVSILADICARDKTRLIHISTDYVFDGSGNTPLTEETPTNPINVYGKSKLEGERHVRNKLNDAYIIRTSWLYSVYGKNFVKTIANLARERESLNVVYDQVGTPTNARDLADVIMKIIDNVHSGQNDVPGVYHYSNLGVTSWYDLAQSIVDYYKLDCLINPIRSEQYRTRATRPKFSVFDKGKIRDHLKVSIRHWHAGLTECLKELESIAGNQ